MATKYIINGELTENAILTPELIDKSTFNVGPNLPVRTDKDANKMKDKTTNDSKQFHQRFFDITYPDGSKGNSVILPSVVIHHKMFDYYDKPSIYIGIPRWITDKLSIKFSNLKVHPVFEDKRIASDASYWWTKGSFLPAAEGEEYIRVYDDEGEAYFGSFAEFFEEYPTSAVANVTCSIKMITDTAVGTVPTGGEAWRAGIAISMVTPYDSIEVAAPTTGTKQKSMIGKKDMMKPGLKKAKKAS